MKTQKRYLSHLLLLNGEILSNNICIVGADGFITAMPFDRETASTEFIDGILVAGIEKLQKHIDDLKSLAMNYTGCDLRKQAEAIRSYIISNDLIDNETKNTVLLSIGNGQFIMHNS